ncbi:MAG: hypothetical protein QW128_08335 [Thermoprotei archaeon]
MSLQELEELRSHLLDIGDSTEVQFVAAEIKKLLAQKGVQA